MVLFYDYKFLKMGIPGNEWFFLFLWFFFLITNFQKWVYKGMGSFFLKLPIPWFKKLSTRATKHTTFILIKQMHQKKCIICYHQYFLEKGFKFQSDVWNGCRNVLVMPMSLNDIAILNFRVVIIIVLLIELAKVNPYI